jgi:hypothetical protein
MPLAVMPKRAMLMTINERWYHWVIEKNRARRTSYRRVERDTRKTRGRISWISPEPYRS